MVPPDVHVQTNPNVESVSFCLLQLWALTGMAMGLQLLKLVGYISGWWFQPLWRIWVRQLGWLFPTEWKHKKNKVPNHQPVYIYISLIFLFEPVKTVKAKGYTCFITSRIIPRLSVFIAVDGKSPSLYPFFCRGYIPCITWVLITCKLIPSQDRRFRPWNPWVHRCEFSVKARLENALKLGTHRKNQTHSYGYGYGSKACSHGEHHNSWDVWMFIPPTNFKW